MKNIKINFLKSILIIILLIIIFYSKNSFAANTVTTGINIKQSDYTIFVGKYGQLNATVSPTNATNKKITWSSSNPKIVKVGATGNIYGVKAGKATISVKTHNGKKDTCIVRVAIPAKSIKLTKNSFVMPLGCTTKLTASFNPTNTTSKLISWKSSNPKVVSVSNTTKPTINLTSKKEGTAVITATSKYGVKTSCKVTVKKQQQFSISHAINVHESIHAIQNKNLKWQGDNVDHKGGTLGAYVEAINILNGKNNSIYQVYKVLVKAHSELKTTKKEPYQYSDINSRYNMKVSYEPANISEVKKALQNGKLVQLQVHSNKWRNSLGQLLSWPGYHSGLIFFYDGIYFHMKAAGKINQKNSIYTDQQLIDWIGDTSQKLIIYTKK